jgi:hypothetical protein
MLLFNTSFVGESGRSPIAFSLRTFPEHVASPLTKQGNRYFGGCWSSA